MGTHKPVALLSMPILSGEFPSFQLALLKPTLERAGIDLHPFSMFMYFGNHIGWRINDALAKVRPCMAGEWLFAKAAFGDFADDDGYFHKYADSLQAICDEARCTLQDLKTIRDHYTFSFLDQCLQSVDWSRFGLFGLSVVFQQTTATLAMARRLKETYPETPIILGGATFEDDIAMSVMEGCSFVDYIHCGDADKSFPDFANALQNGESIAGIPGLMWRDGDAIQYNGRAPNLKELDTTPIPDFDEYFHAREQSHYVLYEGAQEPMLPIETARGCWWGMKNHCTFCGLNRSGMEFRAKSVDNVIEMIKTLSRRYKALEFNAIDNIISPPYIEQLFGRLQEEHTDLQFHYEVRPNLSRKQLRHMRRGGLVSVQPGIESFSTNVLKLMKKHTTAARNLVFLKWCTYYGINNLYNILLGFAGETADDAKQQCEIIAKIPHLQPPWAITQARADRGSPMFTDPENHGVQALQPNPCYEYIYPTDRFDLEKISYFFEHRQEDIPDERDYDEIYRLVMQWQKSWQVRTKPSLLYYKAPDTIIFKDARTSTPKRVTAYDRAAELYVLCDDARTLDAIHEHFGITEATKSEEMAWINEALETFLSHDLMVYVDNRYVSLALPANPYL